MYSYQFLHKIIRNVKFHFVFVKFVTIQPAKIKEYFCNILETLYQMIDYVVSVFKSILVLSLHFCITSTYCENFHRLIFYVNKTQQIRKINNQEEIYSKQYETLIDISIAWLLRKQVSWIVPRCCWAYSSGRFEETYRLNPKRFESLPNTEDEGSTFLRNVGKQFTQT